MSSSTIDKGFLTKRMLQIKISIMVTSLYYRNTNDEILPKRKTPGMIGKDSLTRQKCSSVNFFHWKYFMKGKSIIFCSCHHYFMDLKSWPYFKVEYRALTDNDFQVICIGQ